jgi:mannan endo-1,4-beta-mannosidase
MPWQISKPGNGQGDFEFWTDEPTYDVVKKGSEKASKSKAAQKWSLK